MSIIPGFNFSFSSGSYTPEPEKSSVAMRGSQATGTITSSGSMKIAGAGNSTNLLINLTQTASSKAIIKSQLASALASLSQTASSTPISAVSADAIPVLDASVPYGRQSTAALKTPTTTTGMTVTGQTVSITGDSTTWEDYDFRNYSVSVRANNVTLKNNMFNANSASWVLSDASGTTFDADTNTSPSRTGLKIHYNTFDGAGLVTGAAIIVKFTNTEIDVWRNHFYRCPQEVIEIPAGRVDQNRFQSIGYTAGGTYDCVRIRNTRGPIEVTNNYSDTSSVSGETPAAWAKIVPSGGGIIAHLITAENNYTYGSSLTSTAKPSYALALAATGNSSGRLRAINNLFSGYQNENVTASGGGVSARYSTVTRLMPGKSTDPTSPLFGDYIVGRTSTNTLKKPGVDPMPTGMTYSGGIVTFSAGAAGSTFSDWDYRGMTVEFGSGANNITLQQSVFDTARNTTVGVVTWWWNNNSGIIIQDNDFLGVRGAASASQLAWIYPGSNYYVFRRNYCYYSANDHLKCDSGLIEENFLYGGGTSTGTHYDFLQTGDITPDGIIIRYNHCVGEGDETGVSWVGTNFGRLVPNNNATRAYPDSPIRVYENVIRGFGWQMGCSEWTNIQIYNNWMGDWQYGPFDVDQNGAAATQIYGNKNLSTGALLTETNKPASPIPPSSSSGGVSYKYWDTDITNHTFQGNKNPTFNNRAEPNYNLGSVPATQSVTFLPSTSESPSTAYPNVPFQIPHLDFTVGRTSSNAMKVPGTNALPAGCSITSGTSPLGGTWKWITATLNGTNFTDWDLRGYCLHLNADNCLVTQCLFDDGGPPQYGSRAVRDFPAVVVFEGSHSGNEVSWCTFNGPKITDRAAMVITSVDGGFNTIRYNKVTNMPSDGFNMKAGLVEYNAYFNNGYNIDAHKDGMEITNSQRAELTVRRNYFDMHQPTDGTVDGNACLKIYHDFAGEQYNYRISVYQNVFFGGGHQIMVIPDSSSTAMAGSSYIDIYDNYFADDSQFGPGCYISRIQITSWDTPTNVYFYNNRYIATGGLITDIHPTPPGGQSVIPSTSATGITPQFTLGSNTTSIECQIRLTSVPRWDAIKTLTSGTLIALSNGDYNIRYRGINVVSGGGVTTGPWSTTTITVNGTSGGGGTTTDTTPDPFTFTNVSNASLSTVYTTSPPKTLNGTNAPATISITGGEYQINSGAWVSTSGTINSGDTFSIRGTSSSSYSTDVNVVLTIGGVSGTFKISTMANPSVGAGTVKTVGALDADVSAYGSDNTIVMTVPNTRASGDTILVPMYEGELSNVTITSGYNAITVGHSNFGARILCYYKISNATESSVTVTNPNLGGQSDAALMGRAIILQNAATINASATGGEWVPSGTTFSAGTITTTSASRRVFLVLAWRGQQTLTTAPTGWTQVFLDGYGGTSFPERKGNLGLYYKDVATASTVTIPSFTFSASPEEYHWIKFYV